MCYIECLWQGGSLTCMYSVYPPCVQRTREERVGTTRYRHYVKRWNTRVYGYCRLLPLALHWGMSGPPVGLLASPAGPRHCVRGNRPAQYMAPAAAKEGGALRASPSSPRVRPEPAPGELAARPGEPSTSSALCEWKMDAHGTTEKNVVWGGGAVQHCPECAPTALAAEAGGEAPSPQQPLHSLIARPYPPCTHRRIRTHQHTGERVVRRHSLEKAEATHHAPPPPTRGAQRRSVAASQQDLPAGAALSRPVGAGGRSLP